MTLPFLSPAQQARLRRMRASGTLRELVLFLLVGGTGAVLYTAINVTLTKLGVRPSLSIALTLSLLIPPVYYFQHRLTFRSGRNHWSAFPRYVGAQLFGNIIAMLAAELFPAPIKLYPVQAFILISIIVAALNYGILKFWAFRHQPIPAA